MASGGTRVHPGPAPDPNALRRDRRSGMDKDGWLTLPADGYDGPIPDYPLLQDVTLRAKLQVAYETIARFEKEREESDSSTERQGIAQKLTAWREKAAILQFTVDEAGGRELDLWNKLWRSPQAAAWALKLGPGGYRDLAIYVRHRILGELGSEADAKEARQWSDRFGLNPAAMLRLRWRLATDEVREKRAGVTVTDTPNGPARRSARDRLKDVTEAAG